MNYTLYKLGKLLFKNLQSVVVGISIAVEPFLVIIFLFILGVVIKHQTTSELMLDQVRLVISIIACSYILWYFPYRLGIETTTFGKVFFFIPVMVATIELIT